MKLWAIAESALFQHTASGHTTYMDQHCEVRQNLLLGCAPRTQRSLKSPSTLSDSLHFLYSITASLYAIVSDYSTVTQLVVSLLPNLSLYRKSMNFHTGTGS